MKHLKEILTSIASKRPIFHSEDDLKFELAMVIKNQFPNAEVRLEKLF